MSTLSIYGVEIAEASQELSRELQKLAAEMGHGVGSKLDVIDEPNGFQREVTDFTHAARRRPKVATIEIKFPLKIHP